MKECFLCGDEGKDFYGYIICKSCKSKLGLYTDDWVKKHDSHSFRKEIDKRLEILDEDYKKKRIKLLHIKERLKKI